MKRELQESSSSSCNGAYPMYGNPGKKMMQEEESPQQADTGVDEQLAVLGYNVRASEMAEVAQKLEQLEMVMESAQEDGLSHLSTDTVYYNPSDIAMCLEIMLLEINSPPPIPNPSSENFSHTQPPAPFVDAGDSSSVTTAVGFDDHSRRPHQIYDSDSDLRAMIPSEIVFGSGPAGSKSTVVDGREKKRIKTMAATATASAPKPTPTAPVLVDPRGSDSIRPVVLVDSQENGIRLVHALMACAEAVQQDELKAGKALVEQIELLASSQAGAMRKVATYFGQALAQRIYRLSPPTDAFDTSISDLLEMHFYETCPYLKFAHFTANQAILEAFSGKSQVHVIDFSMKQGMQWPALMQALALRPGGPPSFRLTGIGPPQPNNTDELHQVGCRLAQLAETIHVKFEYRGFVTNNLAELEPHLLDVRPDEAVAVNSVLELHRLLSRPGAMEKVLGTVKALRPVIVTVVEQEGSHNGPIFLDRFTEALHYYSSMFDSLEGCGMSPPGSQEQALSELYLGRQICNVVACEGPERVERHETLAQWRPRMEAAGFKAAHLGSNAFKLASMLLALFAGGDGYRVEENNGCLMLGWHTRPLIATSAWQVL